MVNLILEEPIPIETDSATDICGRTLTARHVRCLKKEEEDEILHEFYLVPEQPLNFR